MNSTQYREFLVKIKQNFHEKIKANKVNSLLAEEVAQMLYFHTSEEPIILRQFLVKATGKFSITWDELLRYLQQGISLQSTVQKQWLSPLSATQIIESNANDFGKLLHYLKQKETNVIQSIKKLPRQLGGQNIFMACLDKQIVVYDFEKRAVLNSFGFSYRKMKEKMFEKEQQKRMFRQKMTHRKTQQYLDIVEVNAIRNTSTESKRTSSLFPGKFLTNNMKASVRGSALSSQKSDNLAFRRNSEIDSKKRNKHQIRIQNDDVDRIFQYFQGASLKNSISIAHAFTDARSNFKKNVILEPSMLQKQKEESSYGLMSEVFSKDFKNDLAKMRHDSLQLSRRRKILSFGKGGNRSKLSGSIELPSKRASFSFFKEDSLPKVKNTNELQFFISEKHRLEIVNVSICDIYLLVSLFNRQIRLLQLKKGLSSVKYEILMEKQFKSVVTHLDLYKSSRQYRMIVIVDRIQRGASQDMKKSIGLSEQTGMTDIEVYQLDESMHIRSKLFQSCIDFSAKYESAFPFGAVLFNEKGCFCLIELKGSSCEGQERVLIQTILYNPETNHRVSISQVRAHRNSNSFYLACSNGYIYLFDKLARHIKYQTYVSPCAILDLQLIHNDTELVSLSKNGNISVHSTLHLEKIYVYQSYHDVLSESKLAIISQDLFYVYSTRHFNSYMLCSNEEKQFNQQRSVKMAKNRLKLKKREKSINGHEKGKVFKVIEGKGGKGDFLALLLEHKQICFLDIELNYIGSYHYLRIHSVVDILCNDAHQYASILTSDNFLQVVNIYTQQLLFTVEIKEQPLATLNIRDTTTTTMSQKLRGGKKKHRQTIILSNFFRPDNPSLFLAVITQSNNVYHYSDKGVMNLSLNIEQRYGDNMAPTQMIYSEECLVLMNRNELTVLHRQSYYKKCVIDVSEYQLIKMRKTIFDGGEGLICVDSVCNILLIDVNLRVVKVVNSVGVDIKEESCLFNRYIALIQEQEDVFRIVLNESKREKLIKTEKGYFITVIGTKVVRISHETSKLAIFNFTKSQFQQCVI